jgi:outer membrane cobalamin receptor
VRGGGTARRVNSDVTSREILGAMSLDGSNSSATVRATSETLNRGIAGSIVQPSSTGREGQFRRGAALDAAWRRNALAWTFTSSATRERETFVDPAPPFGSTYDDTVTATGLVASSVISVGRPTRSAAIGGEARSTDVSSTMLATTAPHWQRVVGAFGNVHAEHQRDSSATRLAVDAAARLDRSSLDGATMLSPRVTASAARGVVTASASLGSAYAPPSLADQFFHEGVLVRPNPDLRAERTRNDVEARVGVHELAGAHARFSFDAAAYRSDIDGMILWLPDYRFVWSPSNNDVRRAGWELSARGDIDLLSVQGTLNRADVRYAGPVLAGQVAYRPRTTGSMSAGFGPRVAHLEIVTRYVGERRSVPGSDLNVLEPYRLTDLGLSSSWTYRRWAADGTLGIDNLLNQPAAMLVDYPFPSRSWTLGLRVRRLDRDRGP